jgi:phage portal protein BeeE
VPAGGRGAWCASRHGRLAAQPGSARRYALSFYAVYACLRLISTDVGKMCLRLVQQDDYGVWTPVESPAFSPVLRKPNHYQTINKFVENWILSKLMNGNAYVLLQRDNRAGCARRCTSLSRRG